MGGGGERGGRLFPVAALDLEHQIGAEFLMQDRRVPIQRVGDVGDRGQRLVVDVDRLRRVLGVVACLGDHAADHIADMAHLVAGE